MILLREVNRGPSLRGDATKFDRTYYNGQELRKKRLTKANISTHGVHVGKLYLLSKQLELHTGNPISLSGRTEKAIFKMN